MWREEAEFKNIHYTIIYNTKNTLYKGSKTKGYM